MRRSLDRSAAVAAFLASAVAVAVPAALSRAPLPSPDPVAPASDPVALAGLVQAARRAGSGTWSVVFAYTREVQGAVGIEGTVVEARLPPWRVVATEDALTAGSRNMTLQCTLTDDGPQCIDAEVVEPPLSPAEVYEVAVLTGLYTVARAAGVEIAGERADCYSLVSNADGALPGLGTETRLCFATDGVPLSTRVVGLGAVDTRVAVKVERDVDPADVRAILARFEAQDRLTL